MADRKKRIIYRPALLSRSLAHGPFVFIFFAAQHTETRWVHAGRRASLAGLNRFLIPIRLCPAVCVPQRHPAEGKSTQEATHAHAGTLIRSICLFLLCGSGRKTAALVMRPNSTLVLCTKVRDKDWLSLYCPIKSMFVLNKSTLVVTRVNEKPAFL